MTDAPTTDSRSQDDRSNHPHARNHPNPRHLQNRSSQRTQKATQTIVAGDAGSESCTASKEPAAVPADSEVGELHKPVLGKEGRDVQAQRGNLHSIVQPEHIVMTDVKTLRERARKHIAQGAVTAGYKADREAVLRLLNDALATEIVCVLRYKRHYFMATGIHAQSVAAEFLEHAVEEQAHADLLAERIMQLGGAPNFDPDQLTGRSHAQYVEGHDLVDMIREDLVAERIAIDSYAEMIRYLGDDDPTTRRMLEGILAAEEEHAEDLISLLSGGGA